MKKFKVADCRISGLFILGLVILGLITMDHRFFYEYFAVGTWQVISMPVHWVNKWCTKENQQRLYYMQECAMKKHSGE